MRLWGIQPVVLWSDLLIYLVLLGTGVWWWFALRRTYWRVALRHILSNRLAMVSFGILCLYGTVGLLDTVHFRVVSAATSGGGDVQSVLDVLCTSLIQRIEETYSAPFATHLYTRETEVLPDGTQRRAAPRLRHAGQHLSDPDRRWTDLQVRLLQGLGWGVATGGILLVGLAIGGGLLRQPPAGRSSWQWWPQRGWSTLVFLTVVATAVAEVVVLSSGYHILGTDKTGQDVLFTALKSVRTGLVIGTLTTLIVTPFALLCGVLAGYFGGLVDDVIQYVYTTLSSIPGILLIAAAMLIFQVGISSKETLLSADERLVYLCVIMGVTSWTGLCRLIRAEVLKLREIEYIQAADALGVARTTIILRHFVPNVMHILLISLVLNFSELVLAEAVLAYVGIGVDPSMQSWGNMINQARLELAREPVVWWNLLAALLCMLGLVLPANVFGDAVRDALDPRLRIS